jgi:nucleotide-binding universal stress UspA family protein
MIREIVVPLVGREADPSGASEQALPYAQALAERLGANLVLVSVAGSGDELETRRTYLDSLLDDRPDRRLVPVVVVADDPAAAIVEITGNLENSIVILASHSRTGLKRMLLGSVALNVVLGTDRPVMVVPVAEQAPEHQGLPGMRRLLVPLEDSFMADAILTQAINTLGSEHLSLHLIDVIEPLSTRAGFMEGEYQSTVRQVATHYLNRVAEGLVEDGFDVEWQIRVGDPALEIATVAEESSADLIVMATHGRNGLGRFIFGSVGKHLAGSKPVPLLLLRPDEDNIDKARESALIVRSSTRN